MIGPDGRAGTRRRGVLANFAALSASTWGAQAIGFLVVVYVARVLGAGALGLLVLAQTVVLHFRLAADMGFDLTGSRRVAADRAAAAATIADLRGCRLAGAAAAAALLAVAALLADRVLPVGWLMAAFGLGLVPAALSLEWAFMGLERMDVVGLARLLAAVVWLLLAVVLTSEGSSPLIVALACVAGQASAAALTLVLFRRGHGRAGMRVDMARWAEAFREAWPVGLALVLIQIYVGFGLVALGLIEGDRAAGLYAAPQRLFLFATGAASMFGAAFYPRLSALRTEGREPFEQAVRLGLRVMVLASVPIAVGGVLVAEPLLVLVYGPAYRESVPAFGWLVPAVVPIFMSTVLGYALLAAGGGRRYLQTAAAAAALSVAANLALIPRLHLLGPAVATLATEGLILVMMAAWTRRFARLDAGRALAVAAVAAAAMAGAVTLIGSAPVIPRVAAGAVVYASVVAALRGITRADLAALGHMARSSPPAAPRPLD